MKEHPILLILGLIVTAFLAGGSSYIYLEKTIDNKIVARSDKLLGSQTLPLGSVVAYYSSNNKIPNGWMLCNGENGTPDLRNKFIRGGERLLDNGGTGGVNEHNITINSPRLMLAMGGTEHDYALREHNGNGIVNHRTGGTDVVNSFVEPAPIYRGTLNNNPEYVEIVYIMKSLPTK